MISIEPIDAIASPNQHIDAINVELENINQIPDEINQNHIIVDITSYFPINTCPLDTVAATRLIDEPSNNICKCVSNKILMEIVLVTVSFSTVVGIIVYAVKSIIK
jgi:hypothetical protein